MHRRPRRSLLWALCLTLCDLASIAAQDAPAPLVVVGSADGQVKLLADVAKVTTTLTIESIVDDPVTGVIRVGPFRDASGRLHPATAKLDAAAAIKPETAAPPTPPPGSLPITLPARGAAQLHVDAILQSEGDYTSEIAIVSGKRRDVVRLVVTRALRDLAVDIEGSDAAHGTACVWWASSGKLQLVLREKIGRDITLGRTVLTKLTQKGPDSARTQAPYQLRIDGQDAASIALTPNESKPITLTLDGLAGAGEYAGTMRIGAPGAKPVDKDFMFTLRESGFVAFVAIFAGVVLSAILRWLSQTIRPKLVESRRAHLLVREIDEWLSEPARDAGEGETLRWLRREAIAALIAIDASPLDTVKARLDRLDARRRLAADWMVRRRQVESLKPDTLRDQFRPIVDAARDLVVNENATTEQITNARTTLAGLTTEIDKALRAELTARITHVRGDLDNVIATRPSSQLALSAPAEVRPLLDEAEAQAKANNLRGALATYDRAQRTWTGFLLDDLSLVANGPSPLDSLNGTWKALAARLDIALRDARALLANNPDAAIRRYNSAWNDYVATVSDGLRRAVEKLRAEIEADQNLDKTSKDAALASLREAVTSTNEARAAFAAGRTQEAVGKLSTAIEQFGEARDPAKRKPRIAAKHGAGATALFTAVDLPPALVDGRSTAAAVGSARALAVTTAAIDRIDLLVIVVAVIVASLLGLTVLWQPDVTWGGWGDRIVALLWGLGFHQFTFTGLAGVTDRLRGTTPP